MAGLPCTGRWRLSAYARTVRSTHAAATRTARAVMMSYGMIRLLSLRQKVHGDSLSVADWIRLFRLRDVPSLRWRTKNLRTRMRSSPLRAAGFPLAPRNPRGSCPFRTGRKSKTPSCTLATLWPPRGGPVTCPDGRPLTAGQSEELHATAWRYVADSCALFFGAALGSLLPTVPVPWTAGHVVMDRPPRARKRPRPARTATPCRTSRSTGSPSRCS